MHHILLIGGLSLLLMSLYYLGHSADIPRHVILTNIPYPVMKNMRNRPQKRILNFAAINQMEIAALFYNRKKELKTIIRHSITVMVLLYILTNRMMTRILVIPTKRTDQKSKMGAGLRLGISLQCLPFQFMLFLKEWQSALRSTRQIYGFCLQVIGSINFFQGDI